MQTLGIDQELQAQHVVAVIGTFPETLVVPQVTHFRLQLFCHLPAQAEVQAALLKTIYRAAVLAGGIEPYRLLCRPVEFVAIAQGMADMYQVPQTGDDTIDTAAGALFQAKLVNPFELAAWYRSME